MSKGHCSHLEEMRRARMKRITTQVVIIGGGATGAGIMRDCALRGIDCILLERDDIAAGTTGRNHGLLHSGARYAVTASRTPAASSSPCRKMTSIFKIPSWTPAPWRV